MKGLDRIGKTEVLHKKNVNEGVTDDTFILSLSSFLGQLTQKQLRALLSAVENGYYEIPKRITADDLARKHGQPLSNAGRAYSEGESLLAELLEFQTLIL